MSLKILKKSVSSLLSFLLVFQTLTPFVIIQTRAVASITPATGGTAISADTTGGTYTELTGSVISEDAVGDIGSGTIILKASSGFAFDTAGNVTATVVPGASEMRVNNATSQTVTPTDASTVTFTVTTTSTANPGALIFSGVKVRPTAGTPLASSGNLYIDSSATATISGVTKGAVGTSFGTLTEIAGNVASYVVTEPATATAGSNFSVFTVTPKDQFGNNTNGAATVNLTVEKSPYNGTVPGTGALSIATVNTSAGAVSTAQSYNVAETIKIKASDAGAKTSVLADTQETVVSASPVNVTTATGGNSISADTFNAGTYTTLTGPVLTENGVGGISVGSVILNAPTGFNFETIADSVTATITGGNLTLTGGGSTQTVTPTTTTITVGVNSVSTNTASTITFSGIKVKPTTGTSGTTGQILSTNSTSVISGVTHGTTAFGTLTEVAGELSNYAVSAPSNATVGTNFVMTVTPRDQSNNTRSGSSSVTISTTGGSNGTFSVTTADTSSGAVTINNQRYSAAETITIRVFDGDSKSGQASSTTTFAGTTASVNPATGGGSISADTVNGSYTLLSGPTISENGTGSIGVGTLVIKPPTGFEFNPGTVNANVFPNGSELRLNGALSQTVTATTDSLTLNISASSVTRAAAIIVSELRVRPTIGTPLASGNLYLDNSSTSNIPGITKGSVGGTNLGTLTETVGALANYAVTAPSTGVVGTNFEIVVTPRDQFNNNRTGSATVNITASGTGLTGVLGVTTVNTSSGPVTVSTQTYSKAQTITINVSDGSKTGVAGNTTVISPATLTGVTNTLSNTTAGASGVTHTIAFTTINPVESNGKIVVTFPDGFNVSGVGVGTVTNIDGTLTPTVAGQIVTLTRSGGTTSTAGAKSIQLTGIVNKTAIGSYTVSVATTDISNIGIDGPTNSGAFTLTAGAVDEGTSTVSATPTTVVADNTAVSTITVTLRDANSNPVSGKTVTLASNGTNNTITQPASATDANGIATGTIKSTKAEAKTITATDTTDAITLSNDTVNVTFVAGPVSATVSTVTTGDINVTANGTAIFTITVTLLDVYSNPVSGKTVSLSSTGSNNTITQPASATNASGQTTGTIASTKAEAKTVTAVDTTDSITLTNTLAITFVAGSITKLVFTTNPQTLVAGTDSTVYTVQTQDAYSNPKSVGVNTTVDLTSTPSTTEVFSLTAGGGSITQVTINSGSDSTNFFYKDNQVGESTITASSGAWTSATQLVTITPAGPDHFVVSGTNSTSAGTAITNIVVTAKDSFNNTATSFTGDQTLTFSGAAASPDSNNPTASDKNNADVNFGTGTVVTFTNGVSASVTLKLYKVETFNLGVAHTSPDLAVSPNFSISVTVGAANKLVFLTEPSTTATAGVDFVTQPIVQIRDAYGNLRTGDITTVTVAAKLASDGTTAGGGTLNGTAGVAAIGGVVTYAGLDYTKAESIKLRATATGLTDGLSSAIAVSNAGVASFVVSGITDPHVAGTSTTPTVEARDAYQNKVLDFTGTVTFDTNGTDTKPTTELPANYQFTTGVGADNGSHIFTNGVRLTDAGQTTLRVRLTTDSNIYGIQDDITVKNAAASQFTLNNIANQTAGTEFNVTVTVLDQYGNIATGDGEGIDYTGTVSIISNTTGSGVSAPVYSSSYTFSNSDNGVHSFPVTLKKAETSRTITASDTIINATSNTFTVNPTIQSQLSITGSSTQTAGGSQNLTITALDQYNNVATGYTGDKDLTFSGATTAPNGTSTPTVTNKLGANINFGTATTLTFASGSISTAAMKLYNAQIATIAATDGQISSTTNLVVTVSPTDLASFVIGTVPGSQQAGVAFNASVTARDTYQNTKTNYTGSVTLTSTDAQVVFSPTSPYPFVAGDLGVKTISVTYKTSGNQTFTVTDNPVTATSGTTSVTNAPATTLVVSGVTDPQTAGATSSVTVTARDPFNNTAIDYNGTISFTSSDPNATLPNSGLLSSGTATFNGLTLKTAGERTVTATGSVNNITGTQSAITVNPGAATKLVVVLPGQTLNSGAGNITGTPTTQTAGTTFSVTVNAVDNFYNVDPNNTATVSLVTSDAGDTNPTDAALVAGSKNFTIDNRTSGTSHTITPSGGGLTGIVSTTYTVNHAAPSVLVFTTQPGAAGGATVDSALITQPVIEIRDAYANVATTANNTVTLSAIRSDNTTPANSTLTGTVSGTPTSGVVSFSGVGYRTTDTIHLVASSTGLTGANSTVDITLLPGAANNFAITGTTTQTAGATNTLTITARDQYNNTATSYTSSKNLTFSGANNAPDTSTPKVTNSSGSQIAFGQATSLNFTNGVASSVTLRLYKAESANVAAQEGSITTTSSLGVTVNPDTAVNYSLATQNGGTEVAGVSFSVALTTYDSYGNLATNYTGSHVINWSWSATQGTATNLPTKPANGNQTFTSGVVTVSGFTLVYPDEAPTIQASEPSGPSGSVTSINVDPGAATTFTVNSVSNNQTAGAAFNLTITAKDSNNNTVSSGANNYTGNKVLVFSGPGSVNGNTPTANSVNFGSNTTVTFNNGAATVSVNLKKAETAAVTVTSGSVSGSSPSLTVAPTTTSSFVVSGVTSPVQANVAGSVTVTAKDSLGNVATNYSGTVTFTSSDAQASLPTDYAFTSNDFGVKNFVNLVILKTVGTQSVTARDTVNTSIAGSQTNISVTAGPLHHFTFTTPSSDYSATVTANTGFTVVIEARDAAENLKIDYTGTIILTAKTGNNSTIWLKQGSNPTVSDTSLTSTNFSGGLLTISDLRLGPGTGIQSPFITLRAVDSSDVTKVGTRVVQTAATFAVGSVEGTQTQTPTLLPGVKDEKQVLPAKDENISPIQKFTRGFDTLPTWAKILIGFAGIGGLAGAAQWIWRRRPSIGKKFFELAMRLFTF